MFEGAVSRYESAKGSAVEDIARNWRSLAIPLLLRCLVAAESREASARSAEPASTGELKQLTLARLMQIVRSAFARITWEY